MVGEVVQRARTLQSQGLWHRSVPPRQQSNASAEVPTAGGTTTIACFPCHSFRATTTLRSYAGGAILTTTFKFPSRSEPRRAFHSSK